MNLSFDGTKKIAAALDPAAFDPDEPWSREMFLRRIEAKREAQRAAIERPEWAFKILHPNKRK